MAVFGYGRVSTVQQAVENQRQEIEAAGHLVKYWFEDVGISGKVPASQRPQFKAMLSKLREGDDLVVAKLDRLGRDAVDVQQTVRGLAEAGVRVIVLALGGQDLTAPAGKLMLAMLSAVAEMERDLLIERTQAGLARAKKEGKVLGRPAKTTTAQRAEIRQALADGATVSDLARRFAVSRATIISIRGS